MEPLRNAAVLRVSLFILLLLISSMTTSYCATNLLANSGFDSLASGAPADWTQPASDVFSYPSEGRSGLCVKFNSDFAATSDALLGQNISITGCRQYTFSAWVKTDSVASSGQGAGVCVDWFRDGIRLGTSTLPSPIGTNDWTNLTGTFTAIALATTAKVYVYVSSGTQGTLWFDDISFTANPGPKFSPTLIHPNYRGQMYGSYPENITLNVTVNYGDYNYNASDLQIVTRIVNISNSQTVQSNTFPVTDIENIVSIPKPQLAPGSYTLNVSLKNINTGYNLGVKQYRLTQLATQTPASQAWFDKDNRLIVNGEPFFPLGLYVWQKDTAADMRVIADAGFNAVMPYERFFKSFDDQNALLATSDGLGVKTIYSLSYFFDQMPCWASVNGLHGFYGETGIVTGYVNALKGNPNILAWYLADEPGGTPDWVGDLQSHYDIVSSLDPGHPCWTVVFPEAIRNLLGTFDAYGADYYPIGWAPAYWHGVYSNLDKSLIYNSKAGWNVPQMCSLQQDTGDSSARPPTYTEMRNMAYQDICAGATGLIGFEYDRCYDDPKATFEQRWGEIKPLARELRSLAPVLISNEIPLAVGVSGSGFSYIAKSYMGSTYIFLVNPYRAAADAVLTIPKGTYTVFVDGAQTAPDSHNTLVVHLGSLQVSQVKIVATTDRTPTGIQTDIMPSGQSGDISALIDGNLGSSELDSTYCGWLNAAPAVTLDYGSVQIFSKIEVFAFADLINSGAGVPDQIQVSYQKADGAWSDPLTFKTTLLERICSGRVSIERAFAPFAARYVRVRISQCQPMMCLSEIRLSGFGDTLACIKRKSDGSSIQTSDGLAITAALDGAFYIEDDSRACGIKVISNYAAVVGDRVTLTGMLTEQNGEKVIVASDVQPAIGTNFIQPLGTANKSLSSGLSMTGLLTKTWGRVTGVGKSLHTPVSISTDVLPTDQNTDVSILVDGNLGSAYADSTYCGWNWNVRCNPILTLDYGSIRHFDTIDITATTGSWAGGPEYVAISYQKSDGTWVNAQTFKAMPEPASGGRYTIEQAMPPFDARYVRIWLGQYEALMFLSEIQLSGMDTATAPYVTIDDGSGQNVKVDLSYVTGIPGLGDYVTVTGICSAQQVIIPRSDADVSWK